MQIELRREPGRGIGSWGNQCDDSFFGLLGYTGWWWRREVGLLRFFFFFAKREIETLVVWFIV